MNKNTLSVFALSIALAACGGGGGGGTVTQNKPGGQGGGGSTPTPEPVVITGDAVKGEQLMQGDKCSTCHNDDGNGFFSGPPAAEFDMNNLKNVTPVTETKLAEYIRDTMPTNDPSICDIDCATDIAAYLLGYVKDTAPVVKGMACNAFSADEPLYGKPLLKMLTSWEYDNSIEVIFGADTPTDYSSSDKFGIDQAIGALPNHAAASISSSEQYELFLGNASAVASWAISEGRIPSSCSGNPSSQNCASDFIRDYAQVAFRRPLESDEKAAITDLITNAVSGTSGLKWAIQYVLASPQFLYRSELGMKVSDYKANGWGITGDAPGTVSSGGGGDTGDYEPGMDGVTINGADFANKGDGENIDGTRNIYSTGSISQNFDFKGNTYIEIMVRGNDYDGNWPEMTVTIAGKEVFKDLVQTYDLTLYEFVVDANGSQSVEIAFSNNDEGRMPYGSPGNDKNLYVGDVTVSSAVEIGSGNQSGGGSMASGSFNIDGADANASVLTPFEYASSLAYMYTGAGPDRELMTAAYNGDLEDKAKVEAHIERMMSSKLGQAHIRRFVGKWTGSDLVMLATRDDPDFTNDVKESMRGEARELYAHVFNEDLSFEELLSGDWTMLDSVLSEFYGLPGGGGSKGSFMRVETTERGGLITTGGFMANYGHDNRSAPVLRAVHIRKDFLCQEVPDPVSFDTENPESSMLRQERADIVAEQQKNKNLTDVERYGILTDIPECGTCHEYHINALFGIDDFDEVGKKRPVENGKVMQKPTGYKDDSSVGLIPIPDEYMNGIIYGIEGQDKVLTDADAGIGVEFRGAKELGEVLAAEESVQSCFVEKQFRFAVGLPITKKSQKKGDVDLSSTQAANLECANERIQEEFTSEGKTPRALLKAIGLSDVVRFRTKN